MASEEVVVVMVPFLAQSHLNQLLHLSRLISAYNIPIHYVSTTCHSRQARNRLHGWNPSDFIHFHDFPDPDFTNPPPNPIAPTEFPTYLQRSLYLRDPVASLIKSLSQTSRRVVVIHDTLMTYVVQDVKSILNAETYVFRPLSVLYHLCITFEVAGRELPFEPEMIRGLPSSSASLSYKLFDFIKLQQSYQTIHVGYVYDSSRVIEGKHLELLERDESCGRKHWALGPVEMQSGSLDSNNRHLCLQWLDNQPENSVVYVSFGTTNTLSDDQIMELAIGLEKSDHRFLWVLCDADKGGVSGNESGRKFVLPLGFEERVKGRGLVMRDWAPQLDILGHLSTGGFMSHCGWNSCMEAMTMGVPIAAWPMSSDQPLNAFSLSSVLGVALLMKEWTPRDELLSSEIIKNVVTKLMDTSEGEAIRKKAVELGGELRRSKMEGGVTRIELESFISFIRR
ncbi:UDP-glucuronosyl/UDP-glucosyltransferase [Artemisia annua]|uniref:Glycosyltransferase n=1 Tax=Artemisia annua TaxID=35608 RepID=A0A2U1KVA9_ARTAN|nr:UDP-glucuronosyl/UDP-glucosyltransferase [Artemisia annua]